MSTIYQVSTFELLKIVVLTAAEVLRNSLSMAISALGPTMPWMERWLSWRECPTKRASCRVKIADENDRTPFATISDFKPDTYIEMGEFTSISDLCRQLDEQQRYQIHERWHIGRLDGCFKEIEVHSVWPVESPYEALDEIVRAAEMWHFKGLLELLSESVAQSGQKEKTSSDGIFIFYQRITNEGSHGGI